MNRRILIVTLLVALLVLLNNWFSGQQEERQQRQEAAVPHVPNYFLRRFTATTMNQQGRPDHRLEADLMVHFADDDTMELTRPRLTLYGEDAIPWQVDAARGRVEDGGRRVLLSGGVQMTRHEADEDLELVTDSILIKPHDRYAETDDPLTITHPQGRVEAVGLRGFLAEERLLLLARVRGSYVPSPH